MRAQKILYLVTEDWYFCSHRIPIARAARDAGYDVAVATRVRDHGDVIRREGFKLIPLDWRRRSINPWHETKALTDLVRLYRRERPDIVHHIALKPAVYGSLAARLTRVPATVNTVAGLGYVFTSRALKARMLSPALKFAIRTLLNRNSSLLILQNPDDRRVLGELCGTPRERTVLIRGSGVDVQRFVPMPQPDGIPNVTMVSRMLWNKGVGELVEATRRLKRDGASLTVTLVGAPDEENPASISVRQLEQWQHEGLVEWLGHRSDIEEVWRRSAIAVLPTTYGEGVPKALIEAAACARPIVATDVPGCREIVKSGESGFLVPPGDTGELADAIHRLVSDTSLRRRMGESGAGYARAEFSEQKVVEQTMRVYKRLVAAQTETTR
ncbi:MAG: glycosyltransferase family 4 protein [Candidatus Latescibacterota bacterium]|nr:MAG: glycosyltransferase family 4 protein [Candidatus Latescibacterota bacterium]